MASSMVRASTVPSSGTIRLMFSSSGISKWVFSVDLKGHIRLNEETEKFKTMKQYRHTKISATSGCHSGMHTLLKGLQNIYIALSVNSLGKNFDKESNLFCCVTVNRVEYIYMYTHIHIHTHTRTL